MNEETKIIVNEELKHKIELENKAIDNTWKSCCIEMDKNAVQYFTTLSVICSIMSFCIFKLITDETCVGQQAYIGLLTLLLGILTPAPVFKK